MTLILGGAKSGKTGFAEKTAVDLSKMKQSQVYYLATALPWDEEVRTRIKKHRDSRPADWITLEYPVAIQNIFSDSVLAPDSIVIFDCLTMWITNLLMEMDENFNKLEAEREVIRRLEDFLLKVEVFSGEIIVISNLVELGLVAPNFLGRTFQDIAGICHQRLAAFSDNVFQVTAGIPVKIK